jgi:hypothetical protein
MYAFVTSRRLCGCVLLGQVESGQHTRVVFPCSAHAAAHWLIRTVRRILRPGIAPASTISSAF